MLPFDAADFVMPACCLLPAFIVQMSTCMSWFKVSNAAYMSPNGSFGTDRSHICIGFLALCSYGT